MDPCPQQERVEIGRAVLDDPASILEGSVVLCSDAVGHRPLDSARRLQLLRHDIAIELLDGGVSIPLAQVGLGQQRSHEGSGPQRRLLHGQRKVCNSLFVAATAQVMRPSGDEDGRGQARFQSQTALPVRQGFRVFADLGTTEGPQHQDLPVGRPRAEPFVQVVEAQLVLAHLDIFAAAEGEYLGPLLDIRGEGERLVPGSDRVRVLARQTERLRPQEPPRIALRSQP
jgi:hypothetical protein